MKLHINMKRNNGDLCLFIKSQVLNFFPGPGEPQTLYFIYLLTVGFLSIYFPCFLGGKQGEDIRT